MKNNSIKNLFSTITGESIIPLHLYFIQAPLVLIFSVLGDPEFNNLIKIGKQFEAAFYSIVLTGIFIIFYKYVIFGHFKKNAIPFPQVLLFIILLGIVKGGSTYFFYVQLKIHDHGFLHLHFFLKVLSAVIVAFWFVPTTSWIYNSIKRFQDLRNNLMMQSVKLKLENLSYKKLIEESKLTLKNDIQEIFSDIKNKLDEIEENKTFENEWPKIAELVRNVAINKVRPKSHQLWEQPQQYKEKLSIWYFIKSAVRLNPFPWKIVIPIFSLTTLISMYSNYGNISFFSLVNASLIIFIMYVIGNFIVRNTNSFNFAIYISILILTCVLLLLNLNIILESNNQVNYLATSLLGTFWLLILTFLSSLVTTVRLSKDSLIEEVEVSINQQKIHKATLSQLEKRINTKLAKFLHGYVQARLMSNALRLENADKVRDMDLATQEIEKLTKDLSQDFGVLEQFDSNISFADELEKIKLSWSGICEIEMFGYKNLKIDQMIIKDFIVDAISEAVSNSVRHGSADKVKITFNQIEPRLLEISVSDNGVGPLTIRPGMGSEIFNLLCADNWKLVKNPSGTGSLLILNVDTSLDQDVSERL